MKVTDQAHQGIILVLLLATPTMILLAMELLTHPVIVRHGVAQPVRAIF